MPAEALLSLSTSANKADFYIFRNGIIEGPFHTGNLAVWSEKSGFKRANAIPFTLESGEEVTIYQKRYNSIAEILPTNLRIRILNTTKLIQSELKDYETHYIQKEHIYRSFFAGVFTLAFILNFLIYFESKDKTQLYFSLFLFFFSVAFNSILTAILSRDSIWVLQAVDTSAGFSYVFFMYFVRHYFAIGNFYPRWDKFIHSVSISFFCIIILSTVPIWVDNSTFIKIRQIIAIVFFLSLIVTIILCLRKKREQTKVFIVAILPFIISIITIIVWALYFYGSTTDRFPFIVDSIVGVCVVWAVIVFSAFLLKRYSRQEKKILNDTLEKEQERNDFIAEQKVQLEKQVKERTAELIASQNQLIQSEKLASLGELTAGIAHEIQNPLNFVNNFSELSVELIDELKSPLPPKGEH